MAAASPQIRPRVQTAGEVGEGQEGSSWGPASLPGTPQSAGWDNGAAGLPESPGVGWGPTV